MSGEMSRQGDASLLLAVLDPPGDWTLLILGLTPPPTAPSCSVGMIRLNPLVLLLFTMGRLFSDLTNGLGISGSTDNLGLGFNRQGREVGPESLKLRTEKASASSKEMENLGNGSRPCCCFRLRASCGLISSLSVWDDSVTETERP